MTQQKREEGALRCPYEYGLKILSGKWQARVLTAIFFYGSLRYSELKVKLKPISDTVLTAMLKELTRENFIEKKEIGDQSTRGFYYLTDKAEKLVPIIQSLCRWSTEFGYRCSKETPPECVACGVRKGKMNPFTEDCRPQIPGEPAVRTVAENAEAEPTEVAMLVEAAALEKADKKCRCTSKKCACGKKK